MSKYFLFRYNFPEIVSTAKSFRNVFVLEPDMTVVRCLNCCSVVGSFNRRDKRIALVKVRVKRIVVSEYRFICNRARDIGNHGHHYRLFTSVVQGRFADAPKMTYYNARGREMANSCGQVKAGCLFEVLKGTDDEVSVFVMD